jgi:hypothetical protein
MLRPKQTTKELVMRKYIIVVLSVICSLSYSPSSHAQIPIADIIKQAVVKVIKAFDLMIQRLQNESIALQNAQKILENTLSKLKLAEIAEWTDKHREMYRKYYDELWKVRSALATYHRIAGIVQRQKQIVEQYSFTWQMVRQDKHFSQSEIDYMYRVYTGILNESIENIDQVLLVINSFKTQMSDSKRLEIINTAADDIDRNYNDLQKFNTENIMLSIARSKDEAEIRAVKKLYDIQ